MMDTIAYSKVHPSFKMNGYQLNRNDLYRTAYHFIKEGEAHEKLMGDFILDWFDSKDYIELSTSGTTGAPKRIRIDKRAMVYSALATGDFFSLQPGNKALHCLPIKYIAGKMMFVRALVLGLDLDVVAPSSHPVIQKDVIYDFVAMVPLQVQNCVLEFHNVKKIIIGGAKINNILRNKLSMLKTEIYETYGMTETITHIAAKPINQEAYSLLPNIKIATDHRNCLVIEAQNISNKIIVTNDLVHIVGEKQFIFLGRFDNVINSGGIKLIPEKIEDKLAQKMNCRFFVAGMQDVNLGEKLVLILESKEQILADTIFDDLDKFEKPKAVFFVPKFLETENGKIKRKEILERI